MRSLRLLRLFEAAVWESWNTMTLKKDVMSWPAWSVTVALMVKEVVLDVLVRDYGL